MLNKIAGKKGEEIAAEYLKKRKYRILEHNFRTRNGEIDLIAIDESEKEKVLVCVEVKLRRGTHFGSARESITYFKKQALERTIQYYSSLHSHLPHSLRIDLVAIQIDEHGKMTTELVKNISE